MLATPMNGTAQRATLLLGAMQVSVVQGLGLEVIKCLVGREFATMMSKRTGDGIWRSL